MTEQDQKQLGTTLWGIADQLRGAMNADDFRDYMLSFLFLRYLSDNYEAAAKKELGKDYPDVLSDVMKKTGAMTPLQIWYEENEDDVADFEQQMRLKTHYVVLPQYLWAAIAEMARTQDEELLHTLQKGFDYIENESFASTFGGLFSEINHQQNSRGSGDIFHQQRHARRCL
jgi:type I restriction enzyme M protein